MTKKKVWLITGAGRGMGADIARAALAAGHAVVATARNTGTVTAALGKDDDLLAVRLDVTDPADAEAAAGAAVERFGRIDVLVNNAGNFYAGFFEEISPQDFRTQVETTLFGPVNVTRAVLPVMRAQHSGLVVAISSTAGIAGQEFCTAYAASKFAVEGWIESLRSPGRLGARARSAARRWRATRPLGAGPGDRRTWRSGRGPGRAWLRCAGRSADRPRRTVCAAQSDPS
jgi:NAD(P)-dependent dehydrogenase (short-subunit alcohol dehydrogenase family)